MLICLGCVAVSPANKVYANCLPVSATLFFPPCPVPLTYKNKPARQFKRRIYAGATVRPDRKITRLDSVMGSHSRPCCIYRKDVRAQHWSNSSSKWNILQSLFWDYYVAAWHRKRVGQILHLPSCPSRFNTWRTCSKLLLSLLFWITHELLQKTLHLQLGENALWLQFSDGSMWVSKGTTKRISLEHCTHLYKLPPEQKAFLFLGRVKAEGLQLWICDRILPNLLWTLCRMADLICA